MVRVRVAKERLGPIAIGGRRQIGVSVGIGEREDGLVLQAIGILLDVVVRAVGRRGRVPTGVLDLRHLEASVIGIGCRMVVGVGDRCAGVGVRLQGGALAGRTAIVGKVRLVMEWITDRSHQIIAVIGNGCRIGQRIGDRGQGTVAIAKLRYLAILVDDAVEFSIRIIAVRDRALKLDQ